MPVYTFFLLDLKNTGKPSYWKKCVLEFLEMFRKYVISIDSHCIYGIVRWLHDINIDLNLRVLDWHVYNAGWFISVPGLHSFQRVCLGQFAPVLLLYLSLLS